ncbi:S41 family peptidase [Mucilaginibacter sp. cycad4]|uniref:S41 family peptidase n=1 Tax=Mucilaginibacter sp. cycad4 TaxID=3342096 RepID=UPI002AAB18B7|nr:S41 family peptidase [Mucilaginibacter gossypii]WPV02796.1 S41 family peptidase [Mucilaginibacter gossypii]
MKRIMTIALLAFLEFYFVQSIAQTTHPAGNNRLFTPVQLQQDYRVLIKTLQEAYPSTYRYNTKNDLDRFFKDNLDKLRRPMTEKQFYPFIAATAAIMKDEHIIPTPSDAYYNEVYKKLTRFLPFNFKVIKGKMYVYKSACPYLKTGDEIITIDGVGAESIIQKLIKYLHRDGYINTFLYRHLEDFSPTQNENIFDLDYPFFYNLKNKITLKIRKQKGEVLDINCKPLYFKEYSEFYRKRNTHEPPLIFKFLTKDIAFLNISSFHTTYRESFKQDFDKLFENVFNQLDSNKTPNLILDLRRCEGGDNSYLLLLSYLMNKPFRVFDYIEVAYSGLPSTSEYFENTENAFFIDSLLYRNKSGMYRLKSKYEPTIAGYTDTYPQPHYFKGKIYVLTSGATGSAAGILSSILRNSKRAVFIGEETGGAMEGPTSLNIPILILPNSKIKIEIPLIRLQLAVKYSKGRGVIPEYEVQPTIKDLINNTDTQLNYTLRLINKKQ